MSAQPASGGAEPPSSIPPNPKTATKGESDPPVRPAVVGWVPPPVRSSEASRPGCSRLVGVVLLLVAGGITLAAGAVVGLGAALLSPAKVRPVVFAAGLVLPPSLLTVWMARRRTRDPHALDWRPFAAGWITPVAIVGTAWFLVSWATDWRHRTAFTPATWAAGVPSRVFLADDLVARGLLEGLDADGVERLLGLPDHERDPGETRKARSNLGRPHPRGRDAGAEPETVSRIWSLGGDRQFMADEELVVEFDEAGRVVAFRIDVRPF